ncbi:MULTISPECIES: hypothetical protein [unclassified Borrelia]|uniref:LIC_12708 family protein n=1 Tax=unclassified Borrelia TaxID=2649934 RepID=UPI001E43DCCA|nr:MULTISPECIES: hypothetical protein [unclassified Borrelia]UGQ15853.1 hypothetical protein LSO06_00760 [Borrelia sp. RT5S]UGQ16962.1 hypothetical protein LSO05_00760 [Borrelia sp. RT1S]
MRKFYKVYILNLLLVIISCNTKTLNELGEKQFKIPFGTLPGEIAPLEDRFNNSSFDVKTYNGLVYIVETKANKLMIFNSYGKLIQAYQNGIFKTNQDLKIKKVDFENIQAIYPSKDFIVVSDKLDSGKSKFDEKENIAYFTKIFILNKDLSIEVLGQEGKNGTPFPQVYDINIDDGNHIAIITIYSEGYIIYSYDNELLPLYKVYVNKHMLQIPEDETKKYNISIDKVFFEVSKKIIYVKTTYYENIGTNENINDLGVRIKNQYLYTVSLNKNKKFEIKSKVVLPKNLLDDQQESFINIIGIQKDKIIASTSIKNLLNTLIWSLDNEGQIKEQMILIEPPNLTFLAESLSRDGILSILYGEKSGVSVYWWNLNTLLKL